MDLSVIYPLHITSQNRYLLKRITKCLTNTAESLPNAEHIIALSGSRKRTEQAKKIINKLNFSITIIDYKTPTKPYSPGTARNVAVNHSSRNHLLFWDIDLLGSQQLFDTIPTQIINIQKDTKQFEMYPCLYLCREYTKSFNDNLEQAWVDATQLKANSIEHFAMATSTILCNKNHFIALGMFDESFIGHMGEDLELLNRLAIAYGKYNIETDHGENHPSKIVAELKGFRKHFATYSTPHLENRIFTTHLYHSTHIGSSYKKRNKNNINLLLNKIKREILIIKNDKKAAQIKPIIAKKLPNYLTKEPLIIRSKCEIIQRKIRKLFTNPATFFKDI